MEQNNDIFVTKPLSKKGSTYLIGTPNNNNNILLCPVPEQLNDESVAGMQSLINE